MPALTHTQYRTSRAWRIHGVPRPAKRRLLTVAGTYTRGAPFKNKSNEKLRMTRISTIVTNILRRSCILDQDSRVSKPKPSVLNADAPIPFVFANLNLGPNSALPSACRGTRAARSIGCVGRRHDHGLKNHLLVDPGIPGILWVRCRVCLSAAITRHWDFCLPVAVTWFIL